MGRHKAHALDCVLTLGVPSKLEQAFIYHSVHWCRKQRSKPDSVVCLVSCVLNSTLVLCFRFKPLQKVDGMSDSLCGSSQHCSSTPEQSVAAQSQHHQQYIGTDRSCSAPTAAVCLQMMFQTEDRPLLHPSAELIHFLTCVRVCVFASFGVIGVTADCISPPPPLYADTSHTLPPFPSPDLGAHPLPERISMADIKKLQTLYRDHCEVRPVTVHNSPPAHPGKPARQRLNVVSRETSV